MKESIIQNLVAVINALNNVTVCGKNNLANLSGSIAVLEELTNTIGGVEIFIPEKPDEAVVQS